MEEGGSPESYSTSTKLSFERSSRASSSWRTNAFFTASGVEGNGMEVMVSEGFIESFSSDFETRSGWCLCFLFSPEIQVRKEGPCSVGGKIRENFAPEFWRALKNRGLGVEFSSGFCENSRISPLTEQSQ